MKLPYQSTVNYVREGLGALSQDEYNILYKLESSLEESGLRLFFCTDFEWRVDPEVKSYRCLQLRKKEEPREILYHGIKHLAALSEEDWMSELDWAQRGTKHFPSQAQGN